MPRFLSRWSGNLLVRVVTSLVLVGVLPLAFAAIRLINLNQQAMTELVEQTHVLAARTASERIGAFLASRIVLANGLAANPALLTPKSREGHVLLSQNLQAWAALGIQAIGSGSQPRRLFKQQSDPSLANAG